MSLLLLIAFIAGGIVGVFAMALAVAASRDQHINQPIDQPTKGLTHHEH